MVRIFFGNRPYALLMLPLLIMGYVALNLWKGHHQPDIGGNFGFWGHLLDQSTYLSQILAGTLIFANGILLNTLFNRNGFMESNNFLPALLYVSFLSIFHSFYYLDGFSIAQTFLILGLFQLLKLSQNEDARRIVFNAAFIIGVACTFYPILLVIMPFLFWMIWVIRPFVFRESTLTVVGITIPLIFTGVYGSVYDIQLSGGDVSSTSSELWLEDVTILGGIVFFMIVLGIGRLALKLKQSSIRLKKLFRVIVILGNFCLLLTIFEYFVFHKKEALGLVFIPLMFFLPYSFGYKKQRGVTTAVFYLFFFFSVGKFFYPLAF
ncbi:MAG: hypothetical protein HRT57_06710 [Crocinitomicaceae bacterium]|nr:hypothetical protein [Crocinitomicaceae bacterium]